MSRRPPRRVLWRRRLLALTVLAGLVIVIVVVAGRFAASEPDFTGVWAGSDPLLGDTRWKISRLQDGNYQVRGLHVEGVSVQHLDRRGKALVTDGGDAGWSLSIWLISEGEQIVTEYQPSDGSPTQRLRFTRVPED